MKTFERYKLAVLSRRLSFDNDLGKLSGFCDISNDFAFVDRIFHRLYDLSESK